MSNVFDYQAIYSGFSVKPKDNVTETGFFAAKNLTGNIEYYYHD